MTQTELAKKLGITRSSVNAWELGISVPSTQYLVELATLFKISTDYILGINNNELINISSLDVDEKELIYSMMKYFESKRG